MMDTLVHNVVLLGVRIIIFCGPLEGTGSLLLVEECDDDVGD